MAYVYVRVVELRTNVAPGYRKKLLIAIELGSNHKSIKKDVKARRILYCEAFWKFSISSQATETFTVCLEKHNIFSPNRPLGGCTIPLEWFPSNRIVRDWFPIIDGEYVEGEDPPHMVLLDVHITTRKSSPFSSRFSRLQVFPTWKRPVDNNVECPALPQIVLVTAPQEGPQANRESRYLTVGIMPTPSAREWQQFPQPIQSVPEIAGWPVFGSSCYLTVPIQFTEDGMPPVIA